MSKPSARRATRRPMRPKPKIPRVAWCTSAPRNCLRYQPFHCPARTCASDSTTRRAVDRISAQVKSAVLSSRTPGVLVAMTPAEEHAAQVDVVEADGDVADGLERGAAGEELRVDPVHQGGHGPGLAGEVFCQRLGVHGRVRLVGGHLEVLLQIIQDIVENLAGHQSLSVSWLGPPRHVQFQHSGILFIRSLSPPDLPLKRRKFALDPFPLLFKAGRVGWSCALP